MNAGTVANTATANGTPPIGTAVTDRSGTDPTNDLDTITTLPVAPRLSLLKTAGVPTVTFGANPSFTDAGDRIAYQFSVRNDGNIPVTTIAVTDAKVPNIVCAATALAPNSTTQCTAADYVITDAEMAALSVTNTANLSARASNGTLLSDVSDDPNNPADVDVDNNGEPDDATVLSIPALPSPDVTMQKTASLVSARRGETIVYTLRLINNDPTTAGPLSVTDKLPQGFTYVAGSAVLDTVPLTPDLTGRNVTFRDVFVSGNATRDIRITVRIGDVSPGTYTNRVQSFDAAGVPVSNEAQATVTIISEAVFDCGDIIGKVFDDKNRNGTQNDGEPGIAGVRLATARGVLITTDKFGRYNVPCAALPDRDIGSNFILKLDARTLPTGYSVTTENPRVVRLTAGKLTKLNFGAAQARVLKIELANAAFLPGQTDPSEKLQKAIGSLVDLVNEEPSVIQLTYTLAEDEAPKLAEKRLKDFAALLKAALKGAGLGTKAPVETKLIKP
ncbi:MAG: DUF7507 domain-containing protein, partial [Notoacmeibacter sp.]